MARWLDSILGTFGLGTPTDEDIAERLRAAQEDGEHLELRPLGSVEADPPTILAEIIRVDDAAIIIAPPTLDEARRMRHGNRFALSFLEATGRVNGEIVCQGRVRLKSDGDSPGHGFRFSLPRALMRVERRIEHREHIDPADAAEVELTSFERQSPIYGRLVNISRGGARLRCQNPDAELLVGQDVYLKMTLPEPVGLVTELVKVLSLNPCADESGVDASVSFHQHIQGLGDLLDSGIIPQPRRKAG